jgi:anti-sigma regulatory factor (Ser/Thr protein kinase)
MQQTDDGVHVNLEPDPTAPGDARRELAAELRSSGVDRATIEDACLVLSELTTNAVLHAASPFSVDVTVDDGCVHIEVIDLSPEPPRRVAPTTTHGRGLAIVDEIALRWGSDPAGRGKVVWCDLPARRTDPAPGASRRHPLTAR